MATRARTEFDRPEPTRRGVLAAGGALALTSTGLLGGCGGDTGDGGEGDRFRAAFTSGGSQETLDPHVAPNFVDQARAKALYDTLGTYADDMSVRKRLAESWESDASGTRWRVRLRKAQFHDGGPVTAEDVLYSYRRAADPDTGSPSQVLLSAVDFDASKADGKRSVVFVLKAPNFEFPTVFAGPGTEIIPDGTTDFREPVGSGPFTYVSFTPGGTARYRAWADHWDGAPRIAELEIVPANEESARLNALLSGQVHYAADMAGASVERLEKDKSARLLTSKRATAQQLLLRTGRKPFDDPRLIRAVQLGIDREALVRIALAGHGEPGNDLFGMGLRGYPDGLEARERDLAQARKLVKQAGAEGLHITIQTSSVDAAWQPAADLMARQLKEVGLKVTANTRASSTYFSEIETKGVAAFNTTSTLPVSDFLQQRVRGGAARNQTEYVSEKFDKLLDRARTTRDEQERLALLARAQKIARDESGLLVWAFSDAVDAVGSSVRGLRAAPPNSHDWARFDRVRIS
ncbi:Glutathione-binding protein GsiB precursor [Streptomyces sp. YIM 130001]|uniref:ABC transporter substrate-binding protein n=1 Tax=Streptomyces sp. YIM 130001 TaxID=2259644 RepID=UPI000EC18C42|nr:ABC transporter substrate-binding protein [Streptomyces sp. YIM 130001]RII20380.1 Glutathione-binding protein GsiB precursor [Streptomyces sp. YIM 130001]